VPVAVRMTVPIGMTVTVGVTVSIGMTVTVGVTVSIGMTITVGVTIAIGTTVPISMTVRISVTLAIHMAITVSMIVTIDRTITICMAISSRQSLWNTFIGGGKTSKLIARKDYAWMIQNAMSIGAAVAETTLDVRIQLPLPLLADPRPKQGFGVGWINTHLLILTRRSRLAGHGVISVTTLTLAVSKSIEGLNFLIRIVAGINPCSIARIDFMICDIALAASLCPRFGLI